jgi:hypothetical protein
MSTFAILILSQPCLHTARVKMCNVSINLYSDTSVDNITEPRPGPPARRRTVPSDTYSSG